MTLYSYSVIESWTWSYATKYMSPQGWDVPSILPCCPLLPALFQVSLSSLTKWHLIRGITEKPTQELVLKATHQSPSRTSLLRAP